MMFVEQYDVESCSWMATYLMKMCLIEYGLMNLFKDENLMYLHRVQKVMKKGIQYVLDP